MTLPNGHKTTYSYNGAGMLASVSDNSGKLEEFTYGIVNHPLSSMTGTWNSVTTTRYLNAAGSATVVSCQYHDRLGRPTTAAHGGVNTKGTYVYTSVSDAAPAVTQNGSMDYPGGSAASAFGYNAFGALVKDESRGVTDISYDNLGNPVQVEYNGYAGSFYVHSATGERLKESHRHGITIVPAEPASALSSFAVDGLADSSILDKAYNSYEFHGPVVYKNGKADMVLFPGGYATVDGGVSFHYYTQDYLGNNRAVVNGSTGAIEQTVAYYPYGGVIPDISTNLSTQLYKFGGKELTTTHGLNEYDFGARQYYSAVPGFTKPDPLCETNRHLSPYLFCGNDPVNNVDPSGMVFTETSQQYIDMFISNIESKIADNDRNIAKIAAQLNKGGLSKKKINSLQRDISKLEGTNASLKEVKTEVNALQESSQINNIYRDYRFNSVDSYGVTVEIGSGVIYNEETDMFDIILGDESLGMMANELKHAYQFETGDFSSGYNKTGLPFYDQTDEVEA